MKEIIFIRVILVETILISFGAFLKLSHIDYKALPVETG